MKKTILVADDYLNEREKMKELLKPDFNVVIAEDGMIASDTFQKLGVNGIDGAVLDYMMMNQGDYRLWDEELNPNELPSHQFYGDAVAKRFRRAGFTGPIIIRSSIADQLQRVVEGLDVYLHSKSEDDQKILDYLQSQLE